MEYLSAVQTLALLADTQDMYCELGRGSGKTTHILAPRMDRVQNSMPGSVQVFLASTYKAIFENLVPGLMEYFTENYERGIYFELGQRPPSHFKPCQTLITDWKNTISFCNGTVIQFVSCERPEQANGKNIAHLYMDEMLHIKRRVYFENVLPALRSKSTQFAQSPYFMGTTGTTSTPNIETDEDWFLDFERQMDPDRIKLIQSLALRADAIRSKGNPPRLKEIEQTLTELRRGATFYLRASSFSNIKILGLDYIDKQMRATTDTAMLNTSIFAVRENRVKDMFFAKFGPMYITENSYRVDYIYGISLADNKHFTCADMLNCDLDAPLYVGYDPGPFTSMVVAQYSKDRQTFYVLKDLWCYWPDQHGELARQFKEFFSPMRCRQVFLHYDRAGNQHNPYWKQYKPTAGTESGETDAYTLKNELIVAGFSVQLMSLGQRTILYKQHLFLLNKLFSGKEDAMHNGRPVIKIKVDQNECDALISSIYNTPLKRTAGEVEMDKSSEKLPYEEQAYNSTQIASAFTYLLWGEFAPVYMPGVSENSMQGFSLIL